MAIWTPSARMAWSRSREAELFCISMLSVSFEGDPAGRRTRVRHRRLDGPGELWIGELVGRQVDRDAGHAAGGQLRPQGDFDTRGSQDPGPDLVDQARLLARGMNTLGAIRPWVG